MASFTRNLVVSATNSLPDKTSETVDLETPARRATSTMVTRPTRSTASPRSVSNISLPIFGSFQYFPFNKNSAYFLAVANKFAYQALVNWNVTIKGYRNV